MVEAACQALITFPIEVDTAQPAQRMRQSCWLGFVNHLLRTKLTERMRFEAGKVSAATRLHETCSTFATTHPANHDSG